MNDTRLVPATIGDRSLSVFELAPIGGGISPVSLSGREPQAADEIALAPLTAEKLGVQPGDSVTVEGERARTMQVSGETFVPQGVHNSYDEGAWVTADALSRLYPSGFFNTGPK